MEKYMNQDGISLNYTGKDTHSKLVREVVSEAIRIMNTYQMNSSQSMVWAINECERFLRVNFNLDAMDEMNEMELISQFNRNRSEEDWVHSMEEMKVKIKEMYDESGKQGGLQ